MPLNILLLFDRPLKNASAGMSALGPKADVTLLNFDVRFTPESGHHSARRRCHSCELTALPSSLSVFGYGAHKMTSAPIPM
jgi:hypothetical protein